MKTATVVCVFIVCFLIGDVHSECLDSMGNTKTDGMGTYLGEDGCNTCFCRGDFSVCTKMMCIPGHKRCMGSDGRIHSSGDSFKSADGCNTCGCRDGFIMCTERACLNGCLDSTSGTFHQVGESFPSSDGCNTCVCSTGNQISCTEMACLAG
ncbi:U-reduvitoxin-Pr21-like [Littorina saxatilis]|uniref:Protease inhibitor n=1 Tax=Littorina saxatilis TaxID=31220 RepID=A0AAN9B722_9CAEN